MNKCLQFKGQSFRYDDDDYMKMIQANNHDYDNDQDYDLYIESRIK